MRFTMCWIMEIDVSRSSAMTRTGIRFLETLGEAINLDSGAATSVGAIAGSGSLGAESMVDIAALVNPGARLRNMSTRGPRGRR